MAMSNKEYVIRFDSAKCIQCHGCEIACKTWRELPHGVQYRRVLNLWQGTYPRIKNGSLSLACLHCVKPACMAACPEKAISKRVKDGLVAVDETLCSGCGSCAEACAFGVPQFGNHGTMQKCDLCRDQHLDQAVPPCVDTCPGGALSFNEVGQAEKTADEEEIIRLIRPNFTRP